MVKNEVLTQLGIKVQHLKQIYLYCLRSDGMSRAQLRRRMGLSFPAVSALVDELIAANIIEEIGTVENAKRGRPSMLLRVCADRFAFPVVAMTADGYHCKIFNFGAEEVESCYIPYGFDAKTVKQAEGLWYPDMQTLTKPLIAWILEKEKEYKLISLVMSTPGTATSDGVLSSTSARLVTPKGFPDYLEQETGLELFMGNNTDNYAYAEYHYNGHKEDFALILIRYGVGASVVRNGKIFETKIMRASEFGHVSIDYRGRPCSCGSRGCIETYISTTVMAEEAGTDFGTLCQKYLDGDPAITALVKEKADILSMGISNMLAMQPMQHIVIGGEIRRLGQPFLDALRESIKHNGFRKRMINLDVQYSLDAKQPEILGAMWNFIENQMQIYTLME